MARLAAAPYRFEFFQAVRVLGAFFARRGGHGAKAAVGERVRFRNSLNLAFPPSELEELRLEMRDPDPAQGTAGTTSQTAGAAFDMLERAHITPSFIGLTGNLGALPRFYTERLLERETFHRDRAARAFLDIFANRAVTLFYQAWEKYRLYFQYERDRRERFLPLVLSLIGLGSKSVRERLVEHGVLDESLAFYSGLLRQGPRPAHVIARILADYFRVPVRITQFVGRWFEVPAAQATALGGANALLGANALCGPRVWQRQTRLRLDIGPLSRERFDGFLPRGKAADALAKLLSMLTGPSLEYEVALTLRRDQVRPAQLAGDAGGGARLGWDSWLETRPEQHDRSDAAYEIAPSL